MDEIKIKLEALQKKLNETKNKKEKQNIQWEIDSCQFILSMGYIPGEAKKWKINYIGSGNIIKLRITPA